MFTLTAAMLIGTPLSASAAGLVDLYKVEDGWGNITDQGDPDNTRTGTVTATQSNSGVLNANPTLAGIVLDETNYEIELPVSAGTKHTLTASFDWGTDKLDEDTQKLNDKLLKHLKWSSSDTRVLALEGKFNGASRDVITLKPKAAGTAKVTVSLDSAEYDLHYSAVATVTVVQYAEKLGFSEDLTTYAVTGNVIDLNEYVETYVKKDGKDVMEDTSDIITYALKADSKTATLKNSMLTLKKEGEIQLMAIGKKAKSEWLPIGVKKGSNAKKIEFAGRDVNGTKLAWAINDGMTWNVQAKVTETKDGASICTDKISWSSKKPAIVEVQTTAPMKLDKDNACEVTLIPKAVGKAQIVAKASSGKSATLNVTVSANLTQIKIEEAKGKDNEADITYYSGQTVDLYELADQYFENKGEMNFTDAGLKWIFDGDSSAQKPMKKVASLNAKGILNIKPDVSGGTDEIRVLAVNAKKVGNKKPGEIKSEVLKIKLEQVNVTEITVKKGGETEASAKAIDGKVKQVVKGKTDTVSAGASRVYTLKARGTIGESKEIVDLDRSVLGWTASGNGKIVKASRNKSDNGVISAIKKGTATITVNSATKKNDKYVAIKTTFKAKVTAPTKTLSLSVKNRGIAATGKRQTISITPVIEKGTTTNKNKDIKWEAWKNDERINSIDKGKIKNIILDEKDLGAEIKVTATVLNGGPKTPIKLTVVEPSKNVEFQNDEGKTSKEELTENGDSKTVNVRVNLAAGGAGVPNEGSVSGVTYTVNKAGIVRVVDNKDGTITIEPLVKGSVKITATTLDGKKGSLNVKVK